MADGIAGLYPGYFALVMATGIVSIAALLEDWAPVAWLLFAVNIVAFAVLCFLSLVRLVRWPRRVLADLLDPRRGPGFFTAVAGTAVVASQCIVLAGQVGAATALGLLAAGLWLVITAAFFVALFVRGSKAGVEQAVSGGWLLAAVATQALAELGALLAPHVGNPAVVLLPALLLWQLGSLQYLLIIGPIFHRLVFLTLAPQAWTPLFWINSGALSITTLAGARLILSAPSFGLLNDLLPFLKGMTLFFWAGATWWIPLLVLVGVWRHVVRRFPLAYEPEYWGLVFPLGMYTVCTFQLAQATGLEPLLGIPHVTVYAALIAWAVTGAGLLRRLLGLRPSPG
jgi:tellurite resistance protein TehA-like permease